MPRGLGKLQIATIALLERRPDRTAGEIGSEFYKRHLDDLSLNQISAVRRAIQSLTKRGIIQMADYQSLKGDRLWRLAKKPLARPGSFKPRINSGIINGGKD